MRRIKVSLTDTQYERLRSEAASSGLSLAELVRRVLDEHYGAVSKAERLKLLDSAFGGWAHRHEDGAAFVERVRGGAGELVRSASCPSLEEIDKRVRARGQSRVRAQTVVASLREVRDE